MRKLVINYYVSLDGKSVDADDSVNGMRGVMIAMDDPEQDAAYVEQLGQAGAFLMGRNSYEAMKGYWPTSDHPSAPAMNRTPKIVFSRTLQSGDDSWPARIIGGDTAEEIARLKTEPGRDLIACAGDEFVQSLISSGLVDEFHLWVLPAVTGKGTPLFPALDQPLTLHLVRSRSFSASGILELVYATAGP